MAAGGLQPIIAAASEAADFISPTGSKHTTPRTPKAVEQHDELGAQCARCVTSKFCIVYAGVVMLS